MLDIRHLEWSPLGEGVIRDIDLHIDDGKMVVVTGPNGGGKTSLAKLIAGINQPTGGHIYFNGEDITAYCPAEYQQRLSVVFQDVSLLSFTVEMNVSGELPEAVEKEKVKEALRAVGLWEKVQKLPQGPETYITQDLDENGVQFSGGETQKLTATVKIRKPAVKIVIRNPIAELEYGKQYDLNRKLTPSTSNDVTTWKSSDKSV